MDGSAKLREYFENIKECSQAVKDTDRRVYIYGMGNGAQKVLRWCEHHNIKVSGIFASDDFVRGQGFHGFEVMTLEQAESIDGELTVLLAFGTELSEIMDRIDSIAERHELFAPEVSVADDSFFEKKWLLDNFDKVSEVYGLLCDEQSRTVFRGLTAFKISGRLSYLREIFTNEKKPHPLLGLGKDEIYCDLGAYNGDTVLGFARSVDFSYKKIYALEPEKRNFQKCVKNCTELDNIELINAACWSHDTTLAFDGGSGRQAKLSGSGGYVIAARSLDSVLSGGRCTYIKYDVEGADIPALMGSRETIKKYSPKICCALYHRCYDYILLPLLINSLNPDYSFFMRQDRYYPAWETELFAMPNDGGSEKQ